MITPELLEYIRGEFARGRAREEVHAKLVADGGWSEVDLNEAFRTVIPMQGFATPKTTTQSIITTRATRTKTFWQNSAFIIVGLVCVVSWYFFRPSIVNFWNGGIEGVQELSVNTWNSTVNSLGELFAPLFGANKTQEDVVVPIPQNNPIIKPTINIVKDCGTSTAPNLKNPKTYQNNAVLACLGNSALGCKDAKAILKDPLFPDVFQIIGNNGDNICNFKLSYGQDSALKDINGNKLAGQYISCPLSIAKTDSDYQNKKLLVIPSADELSKYASQIYFYGTLGIFIENNVDQNKIKALGCSGEYISSVIASYQKAQSQ